MVLFDRVERSILCDKIVVDDVGAGYKATKFLIETGCKKIALLTTPEHVNVGALRREGYEKALFENKIASNRKLILEIDEKINIEQQIENIFEQDIDAVFAVNEIYAATAIRIAKEKGIKIPEEISVIGFTDGLISEFSSPSITTVAQHGFTMGKQAVELLIERIEQETEVYQPKTIVISSELKLRESTKTE